MKDGFIKVAAGSVITYDGNAEKNAENIIKTVLDAENNGVKALCFPELCISGIDCGSMFYSDILLKNCKNALLKIAEETKECDIIFAVGLPVRVSSSVYNCAAVIKNGEILCLVPSRKNSCIFKRYESEESVYLYDFIKGEDGMVQTVPFTDKIIFSCSGVENYKFGVCFGKDFERIKELCKKGAKFILSLSSDTEEVTSEKKRKTSLEYISSECVCAIVSSECDSTETTAKGVYSSNHTVYEAGKLLVENPPFGDKDIVITEIDVDKISNLRMRIKGYGEEASLYTKTQSGYDVYEFEQDIKETRLSLKIEKDPFMPDGCDVRERCEKITKIQTFALKKRMISSHSKKMVIGISGGLDSTLALLICVKTADAMNLDRKNIVAVTMPCFGTSERTKSNAVVLCEKLGVDLRTVDITEAVRLHFKDISHDEAVKNAAYENSQARERTQVLMDIANDEGGIVIGTGDLSEAALGWCTYNGDHMSMYGVNCSIPKTLMRKIVENEAKNCPDKSLSDTLFDILNTPVSPELMPPEDGKIAQFTEDIIGPYELHDFFIYQTVKYGFTEEKIIRMANYAFEGKYKEEDIKNCFKVFKRRFATQQFKRSCAPDGAIIGSVNLSNYSGFTMPSDVDGNIMGK